MIEILRFLTQLELNNNKDWFSLNKDHYEHAKEQMLLLSDMFINEIKQFDGAIASTYSKDCLFRINRDVRFSPDKRPYKNHLGSHIAPGGRNSILPGYYIHIQPQASFIAGGVWNPSKEILQIIREEIAENGDEFLTILNDSEFKKHFPEMEGEKLKTAPKGFDKEHTYIDLLRYKSFTFSKAISDENLLNGTFFEDALNAFEELYKANQLFRSIISELK